MASKIIPIKYTSRDFNSIKADLVEYAKRYYPDTFKDFNEASFGALMLDTVAYVGDVLSFYMDYQINESFIDTAVEYSNVLRLARQQGYKIPGAASSFGEVSLYILIPANSTGLGPDPDFIPTLMEGSTFSAQGGTTFSLLEDIDFSNPDNEVVAAKINEATGVPTHYAIKAYGKVVSGRVTYKDYTVGTFKRFRKIRIGPRSVGEVLSVTDSEGNRYYEVGHLSQNMVYAPVANVSDDRTTVPNIIKPLIVPRRYVVERNGSDCFIQFGHGSESELNSPSIEDPRSVAIQVHAKKYTTDREFDPNKLLFTDTMGIGPQNTTIRVTYRTNGTGRTGAAVNGITRVQTPIFNFKTTKSSVLADARLGSVKKSLELTNESVIPSASGRISTTELKKRVAGHYAAQNRAVTKEDYLTLVYTMPAKFGSVKRANILRDPDSFKRNLNLYIISETNRGHLTQSTTTLKQNIKTWLNQHRMLSDTIDILDAKIINFGIEFEVKAMPNVDKTAVYTSCRNMLRDELSGPTRIKDIGEPLSLSRLYTRLNNIRGVMDVKTIKVLQRSGTPYSQVVYDIKSNMTADGQYLKVPDNCVIELKYPSRDIQGTVR